MVSKEVDENYNTVKLTIAALTMLKRMSLCKKILL